MGKKDGDEGGVDNNVAADNVGEGGTTPGRERGGSREGGSMLPGWLGEDHTWCSTITTAVGEEGGKSSLAAASPSLLSGFLSDRADCNEDMEIREGENNDKDEDGEEGGSCVLREQEGCFREDMGYGASQGGPKTT